MWVSGLSWLYPGGGPFLAPTEQDAAILLALDIAGIQVNCQLPCGW